MGNPTERVSVHDLDGQDLEDYIASHIATYGIPPLAGGDDGGGVGGGGDGGDGGDGGKTGAGDGVDWQAESRKHEDRWKAKDKTIEELTAKVAEFEESKKTEQEKAVSTAVKDATEKLSAEFGGQLRTERLNSAIARRAANKFADVDDAVALINASDDLFDGEGKVDTKALDKALDELLEKKPHLKHGTNRVTGDGDGGKGSGGGGKSMNDLLRGRS